jgi:hypothetical protein
MALHGAGGTRAGRMIIRETIIAAVLARVAAIPGLAACELLPPQQPSVYPSLSIDDLGHRRDESDATHSRYTLSLQFTGLVEGAPGPENADAGRDAHAQANRLYADLVRVLMADNARLPEVPGNVVELVDEGPLSLDVSTLASDRILAFTLDIEIQFINRRHDPALP